MDLFVVFYFDNVEIVFWDYLFVVFFFNLLLINVKIKKKKGGGEGVIVNWVLVCFNICNGILSIMKWSNVG